MIVQNSTCWYLQKYRLRDREIASGGSDGHKSIGHSFSWCVRYDDGGDASHVCAMHVVCCTLHVAGLKYAGLQGTKPTDVQFHWRIIQVDTIQGAGEWTSKDESSSNNILPKHIFSTYSRNVTQGDAHVQHDDMCRGSRNSLILDHG